LPIYELSTPVSAALSMAASAAAARRLAVITGASQGYGRAVAKALAKASTGGQLEILLAARSLDGLSETAKQVGEVRMTSREVHGTHVKMANE